MISEVLDWQSQIEIDPLKINFLTNPNGGNKYPFYGQSTLNNGIISHECLVPTVLNNLEGKPTILIHSNNQNCVYVDTPFYLKDGHGATSVLQSPHLDENVALYFITAIKHVIKQKFDYDNKATKIALRGTKILLPSKNNKVDYDFIRNYVAILEAEWIEIMKAERVQIFNAYLYATGFTNIKLTEEEEAAIVDFKLKKQTPFIIGSLFTAESGNVDIQNKDINGRGCFFINSGITNCGIKGKTDIPAKTFSGNTITIDFFGNAYYRPYEYKLATHNHVFSFSGNVIQNERAGLYLVGAMSYLNRLYSFSNMATIPSLKDNVIYLPTLENGEIDFKFMETYISAQTKLCIRSLIGAKDLEIETTEKFVNENN